MYDVLITESASSAISVSMKPSYSLKVLTSLGRSCPLMVSVQRTPRP